MSKLPPLARSLKKLREQAGLSQQALAVAAGLSTSVVAQLEQGKKTDPRASTLQALAKALGVPMDSLMPAADPPAAPEPPKPARKPRGK